MMSPTSFNPAEQPTSRYRRFRPARLVLVLTVALALTVAGVATSSARAVPPTFTQLQRFARCIKNSGAKFYGAHWCPRCTEQKEMFGKAARYLPYVECYKPGTRDKLAKCKDVNAFPKWIFGNGQVSGGRRSFESLAHSTGCAVP